MASLQSRDKVKTLSAGGRQEDWAKLQNWKLSNPVAAHARLSILKAHKLNQFE